MRERAKMALYGNVALERRYCADCCQTTLVVKGNRVCCGQPSFSKPTRYKRMAEPEPRRRKPSPKAQSACLGAQQNRCFYCDMEFGNVILRNGTPVLLRVEWDHYVPYSHTQDNNALNVVAACQVCNGLKSNLCFGTLDEAKSFLVSKRLAKGYL